MILFCGIPSEPPLALAIDAAERADVEFVVLNQRQVRHSDICLRTRGGSVEGVLWTNHARWPLEEFDGVYARLMDTTELPENREGKTAVDPLQVAKSRFFHELLHEWLELASCRVVNRTSVMASNVSKPYQAQRIQAAGFRTPTTLVTNDPDEALAFVRQHGRVIYKSTSSVRSIVREWTPDRTRDLGRLRNLPVQLQAWVPGDDLRVHVVGERLFATRIRSAAVDYRYAGRDGRSATLEPERLGYDVAARCHDLARRLELPFCGIDLREAPGSEYYCFEVNPSPAYSYYEHATGQPIAAALVEYLAGGSPVAA